MVRGKYTGHRLNIASVSIGAACVVVIVALTVVSRVEEPLFKERQNAFLQVNFKVG
jgi:hypothetical protein